MEELKIIEVKEEPCELYKLLKMQNLVQSGGEAKVVISQGQVKGNNVIETRKRKKIFVGDIIEFNAVKFRLLVVE